MEYENNIQDDVNSSTYADNSFYEGDSYAQLGSGVDSDGQLPEEIETSKVKKCTPCAVRTQYCM